MLGITIIQGFLRIFWSFLKIAMPITWKNYKTKIVSLFACPSPFSQPVSSKIPMSPQNLHPKKFWDFLRYDYNDGQKKNDMFMQKMQHTPSFYAKNQENP